MALTPGSDVDFKFLVSNGGDKCLNSGARPTAKPSFGFQSGVVEAIVQLSMKGWKGLRIVTTPFQERSSESPARPQLPPQPERRIFQERFQAALHNRHGMRSPPVR